MNDKPIPTYTVGAVSTIRTGIGFGSALAIAISWSVNQSILWAIVHGLLSWFYVIYFALTREPPAT